MGRPREYFRPDYRNLYAKAWGLPLGSTYADYLAEALKVGMTPNGTFSAKLHWGQFAHLLGQLNVPLMSAVPPTSFVSKYFPNPVYLYLTRRNKVRQAISLYKAIHLDVWWKLGAQAQEDRQLPFLTSTPDFQEIARLENRLIDHESCWNNYFERGNIEPITLTYEDLDESYKPTVLRILRLLNIPITSPGEIPSPTLIRQADDVSEDWAQKYQSWREVVQRQCT